MACIFSALCRTVLVSAVFPAVFFLSHACLSAPVQWGTSAAFLLGGGGKTIKLTKNHESLTQRTSIHCGTLGAATGVSIGAHALMNHFLVGVSADALMQFGKKEDLMVINTETWNLKTGSARFGLHINAGYQHHAITPYVKLGTRFKKTTLTMTELATYPLSPDMPYTFFSQEQWRTSLSVGVGVCWAIHDTIDFGIESTMDFYPKSSSNTQVVKIPYLGSPLDTAIIDQSQDFQGLFFVRYRF